MRFKRKILVLDKSYQVMDVFSFKYGLSKWGKSLIDNSYPIQVISYFDDIEINVNGEKYKPPSILRFGNVNVFSSDCITFPFNKENIWIRDNGICQYCGKKISIKNMTLDHVYPKSKGGKNNWENIVCCCWYCNNKKSNKIIENTDMKLRKKPFDPNKHDDVYKLRKMKIKKSINKIIDENWNLFLN